MQHNTQGHVYRAKNVDRVVTQFGSRPPEETRSKIRESLGQEKDRFLTLERMRSQRQQLNRSQSKSR